MGLTEMLIMALVVTIGWTAMYTVANILGDIANYHIKRARRRRTIRRFQKIITKFLKSKEVKEALDKATKEVQGMIDDLDTGNSLTDRDFERLLKRFGK